MSFKENAHLAKDSNVAMELPPYTTIAYGLSELEVKPDGHYGEQLFIIFVQSAHTTKPIAPYLMLYFKETAMIFLPPPRAVSHVGH